MDHQLKDGVQLRRADANERFVAFAFAASEMIVEVDTDGVVTFAAGAFRSRLGCTPEDCMGGSVADLVAPADREMLRAGLSLLSERGRLLPWTIRLANRSRSQMALAGLRLAQAGRPIRLCLTFSLPPAPLGEIGSAVSSAELAKAAEARLRAGLPSEIGLLEIKTAGTEAGLTDLVGAAIETIAPESLASEISPGRFGLLPPTNSVHDLVAIATQLESALRGQGVQAAVASTGVALSPDGLTRHQAARALRHALSAFARDGSAGLDRAGFKGGLAGYVSKVACNAGAMRAAIKERRFGLLFQPIVSLQTRALHHYEALLRPQPVAGSDVASPQAFVELVETLGLSAELDLAVAGLASSAADHADVPIAFNISGQSAQDPAFRDRLLAQLMASPARQAGRLVVEMTETAEVENLEEASRTADALKDIGVPFCLDDFGAGSADVRVLRAIAADIVKLDGSYIPGLANGGRERSFVGGLIEVARAAGAEVVAERVETAEEAEMLRELGVQYGQGWLFGRPAPLPSRRIVNARRQGANPERWG